MEQTISLQGRMGNEEVQGDKSSDMQRCESKPDDLIAYKVLAFRPKLIFALSLGYLLLPNLLFLSGWTSTWSACALIVGLVVAYIYVVRSIPDYKMYVNKEELLSLFIVLVLAFLLTELIGFHGHSSQHGDFFVRNPVYETLIRCDWPLFNADGDYFVYYLSYWLPPALTAKITKDIISPATLLMCWTYLGLSLACAVLFIRLRKRVVMMFCLLVVFGSCWEWLFIKNSIHFHAQNSSLMMALDNVLHSFRYLPSYVQWRASLNCTFNHALPFFIAFSLLVCPRFPKSQYLFASALMVSASPLAALTLLFVLIARLLPLQGRRIRSIMTYWPNWVASLLVLVVALYFKQGKAASFNLECLQYKKDVCLLLVSRIAGVLLVVLPLVYFMRKYCYMRLFKVAVVVVVLVLCSSFFMGLVNNELQFKGSLMPFCCFSLMLTFAWRRMNRSMRVLMLIWLIVCSGNLVSNAISVARTYTWNSEKIKSNIRDGWEGHLYHPEHWVYPSFWGNCPSGPILLHGDGESAAGLMGPVATGVKNGEEEGKIRLGIKPRTGIPR